MTGSARALRHRSKPEHERRVAAFRLARIGEDAHSARTAINGGSGRWIANTPPTPGMAGADFGVLIDAGPRRVRHPRHASTSCDLRSTPAGDRPSTDGRAQPWPRYELRACACAMLDPAPRTGRLPGQAAHHRSGIALNVVAEYAVGLERLAAEVAAANCERRPRDVGAALTSTTRTTGMSG